MAEVLLFHHAHGRTPGLREFAEVLRRAGHIVHAPDLYQGHVFDALVDGVAYAEEMGLGAIIERGVAAAEGMPGALVYAGFSLGAMPAQRLAQTRPGALGALLFHACIPVSQFGGAWPRGVPVQIHGMEDDEFFAGEGDIEAARALVEMTPEAELFLYPGDEHLFADRGLPSFAEDAASLLTERVLRFLDQVA